MSDATAEILFDEYRARHAAQEQEFARREAEFPLIYKPTRVTQAEQWLTHHGYDSFFRNLDLPWYERKNNFHLDAFRIRDQFIARFGFAILTTQIIDAIKPYGPILEVGAGSGYWAKELHNAGIDVVATDSYSDKYCFTHGSYFTVERLTARRAIARYPSRSLLMVWPSYGAAWPYQALMLSGDIFIYVGEGEGGCTADDTFHTYIEKHFTLIKQTNIPQFPGIHDSLFIYRRNLA
jgi:hypothetical protein